MPVRIYEPERRARHDRLPARRRLGAGRPRVRRRRLPRAGERVGRARGQHRLPARARASVPGGARRRARGHAGASSADVVAGDSAGANLAAVVARRLRDQIKLQLLVYPVTDAGLNTPSYGEFDERFGLTAAAMQRFWGLYLNGADGLHPDASPLRATDLEGAPPAYILTASHDVLRDEGEAYAAALERAGVPVDAAAPRGRDPRLLALADDRDRSRRGARGRRRGPRCTRLTRMAFWHPFADMGAVSRKAAGHRARRGPVGLRRRRAPLPRRHRVALVRQSRARADRDRRRRRGADEAASRPTTRSPTSATGPANEVCEALAARAPMPNAKVFLTSGGGDSIEVAAKLARRHFLQRGQPERVHLISRTQGYHGTHGFGTSLGGIEANVTNWGPLVPQTSTVPFDSLPALEEEIRRVGPGEGRRVLLRAGDRRRRRPRPARGLHPGRRRPLRRARHPARDRRRDLRASAGSARGSASSAGRTSSRR